jgi:hypothetical protein
MRYALIVLLLGAQSIVAAEPAENLFPATTKGFVSTPSVSDLRAAFKATQLGDLAGDDKFRPLLDDLEAKFDERLVAGLGFKLDDLGDVTTRGLAMGLIQPDAKDRMSHAVALIADVKEHRAAAEALLAAATKTLLAEKAVKKAKKIGEATLTIFERKPPGADKSTTTVFCLHADTLIATDHEGIAEGIVTRLGGKPKDSLASVDAFGKVTAKAKPVDAKSPIQLHWFMEPLGYAETSRAAQGGKKRRGVDLLKVLRGQGFEAVQGIGGCVQVHPADREALYTTYAYAPPAKDAKKGETYKASANLLEFPNMKALEVQPWVPNKVSNYLTFNTVPDKVFKYAGSLYDAYFDEPGLWKETIDGIKAGEDKGPPLDLSKELVDHLSGRVTLITHYVEPLTATSERMLLALELKPGKAAEASARAAIAKLMARRDTKKFKVEGEEAWELLENLSEEAKAAKKVPKSEGAIVVLNGHLFFGSHVDYFESALKPHPPAEQLANAADLKLVRDDLIKHGSGNDSFRSFTRQHEAWRLNYHLTGKGDMPVAETRLAKFLNRLFPSGMKGVPRKQIIDPKLLPPFEAAESRLGVGGSFTQSDGTGWLTVGNLLKKE